MVINIFYFSELILNFNEKKEIEPYKTLYEYLRLNFVYLDENGNLILLSETEESDTIGYLIMDNNPELNDKIKDIIKFYNIYILDDKKTFIKINILELRKTFKENNIETNIDNDDKIPEQLNELKSIKTQPYHGFTYFKDNKMVLKFINLNKGKHGVLLYNTKTNYQQKDILNIIKNEIYHINLFQGKILINGINQIFYS